MPAGIGPLLPDVCSSANFIIASPAQITEYANSESVVSQLLESLAAWLSHCDQVFENVEAFFRAFDADSATVEVHDELICDVAAALRRLELETSFFAQFETDEVKAVRRVLELVPQQAKAKLDVLDANLKKMEAENSRLARSKDLFGLLDSYCQKSSPWTLYTCDDTLPPLFCALRAIYICCPLFGKTHPERFSSLVRCVLKRVEMLIATTVPPLLLPAAISTRTGIEDAIAVCLAAQAATVAIQEEFHRLRISVAEAVSKQHTAVIYTGIDENTVFAEVDFYYDRCVILLHLLTVVKQRKEELFLSGSYVERLLTQDLLGRSVAHEDLIDAIRSLADAPSMRPRDIIARIETKSQEYQTMWKKREVARIMEGHAQLGKSQSSSSSSGAAAAAARRTRVGDINDVASRDWSLKYGDQQQALNNAAPRNPYYSLVVAFNPPQVQIAGIPLTPKQLETIAVAFQDAIRSRVSHTAASIRSNNLDVASISAATAVLKAPYCKFRSASEELADARYEAQERTFHKGPTSNSIKDKNETLSLEAELMQLRRYHVAASHNANTLEVRGVMVDDEELQSYAILALLDCFEGIDGALAEMATTNAFTGDDGVQWNFFVFRYLPSMSSSKRNRSEFT